MGFPRYLELALYHPEFGYYASGRARIGRTGDFFTNVSVGPVYAQLLAGVVMEAWREAGCPAVFHLFEQGVYEGELTGDLREEFKGTPDFYSSLRHHIIEPFPLLEERQRKLLGGEAGGIEWHRDLPLAGPVAEGFHLSNELVDAFPFYVVRKERDGWKELRVGLGPEGGLGWEAGWPQESVLSEVLENLPGDLPEGYQTEVRLNYRPWLEKIGASMVRGKVLLCDYGYPAELYYLPERSRGTLYCYAGHRRDENPLVNPGEKDISAHVDFTALQKAAGAEGFRVVQLSDQHHFLTRVATPWLRSLDATHSGVRPSAEVQRRLRQLGLLLHPETMGRQFHFLELEKPG